MENLNASEIKSQVSIVDLLSRLGYKPVKSTGKELMYLSMLRSSDTKPSLSVNDELGVWFDHGSGQGGTVIDFGIAYWANLSFVEVLAKIVETSNLQLPADVENKPAKRRKRLAIKLPHYKIEEIKPLGTNQVITDYLQSRGVWNIENELLMEIYYYVEDEKKLRKHFFAVGWQNELEGWEVRNKYFKGCLGRKALSFIQRDSREVLVFEGRMNYLTFKRLNPACNSSIIILNSLTTLDRAIKISNSFSSVVLYFDHDLAGRKATDDFIASVTFARDDSGIYTGYNDFNDKLIADLKAFKLLPSSTDQNLRSEFPD